ncbi:MAG: hypothetical protein PHU85_20180, partial [Phycisphaerae bacterium]|nr:hypothetical protein [Phycisphaerae bacterium]
HFNNMAIADAKNQTSYKLAAFTSELTIDGGRVKIPFRPAMEGGVVRGQVSSDLNEPTPMLAVEYEAQKLIATKAVQPLVEAFFPGMTISGFVTMKEKNRSKLLPEPGEANWPVGSGELVFENGLLVGQAGPDWMAAIFPGLKLTKYKFDKMHDWFRLTADGRAEHNMIFDGTSYDIYMTGFTHRGTGEARYTVGVDLLASLDSRTMSVDLQQGKIPLMEVSGKIVGRQLADASYVMVLPPVALFQMLIRDNILYRGVIERALRQMAGHKNEDE